MKSSKKKSHTERGRQKLRMPCFIHPKEMYIQEILYTAVQITLRSVIKKEKPIQYLQEYIIKDNLKKITFTADMLHLFF